MPGVVYLRNETNSVSLLPATAVLKGRGNILFSLTTTPCQGGLVKGTLVPLPKIRTPASLGQAYLSDGRL